MPLAGLLAFAARSLPALSLAVAVLCGVYAAGQHRAASDARARSEEALSMLVQCQQRQVAMQAQGQALEAKALAAAAAARNAREAADRATAKLAVRPVARTCEEAIAELSASLGDK